VTSAGPASSRSARPHLSSTGRLDAVDLIRAKRDGDVLTGDQIEWFIEAYASGALPDEQAAAFLMAVFWRGMTSPELVALTGAMVASGELIDLSGLSRPSVDKHSTGGVGDKVSLVLVPLLAAMGAVVPQVSGRGLGHTGGTLDKLEAIPGWRSNLTTEEMLSQLGAVGCAICAAGPSLAPADRKLYALRDVTATVESIPLIASSIMSKKIAEGTSALVLDVKVGNGAFMAERARAAELAATMVELGRARNMKVAALLTAMDAPLGRAVGNALEVTEAVEALGGQGPPDLVEVTVALAQVMLELIGLGGDPGRVLQDGSGLAVWKEMVRSQGGDPDAILPVAAVVEPVIAERAGFLQRLDARPVGIAAWRLGAGRSRKEDPVSAGAGVRCLVKPGEAVEKGQVVLELHTDDAARLERSREVLKGAFDIAAEPPVGVPAPLVLERVG
jgi:thymidine phosphorylase